jgi:uncharacterized membrane protein
MGADAGFIRELMTIGIVSYREQETLWKISERCAKETGSPMAVAGFIWGLDVGTVTLPVIGTISGAAAGALAGLFSGTVSCVMLNYSVRNELRSLARDSSGL